MLLRIIWHKFFVWTYGIYLWVELLGHMIMFKFLRNWKTFYQNGCIVCWFQFPLDFAVLAVFVIIHIFDCYPSDCEEVSISIMIFISQMANDIRFFFMYLLVIYVSFCRLTDHSVQWQNDLSSFPRQTIQYHSNLSLCPNQ